MKYTAEMIDFLREKARETWDRVEITRLFNERFGTNKKKNAIKMMLWRLGDRARQKYRQDELDFVREKLPHVKTREELARLFNEHFHDKKTKCSINYIVRKYFPDFINKTPYTKEMDDFLKTNASPDISYAVLTKMFNEAFKVQLAIPAISAKCLRMGLSCGRGADAELLVPCDRDKTNNSPDNMEIMTRGEFQSLVRIGMYSEEPEVTKAGILFVRLTRRLKELQKKEGVD